MTKDAPTSNSRIPKFVRILKRSYPDVFCVLPYGIITRGRLRVNAKKLKTASATIQDECLFRVQIPTEDVSQVLEAVIKATPLRYGNYEQVIFRSRAGIQQYKPLVGSKTGEEELTHIWCDEISFTVPKRDETISAVIDALFESHPHEEPVIHIQEVMCTRFKYGQMKDASMITEDS